MLKARTDFIESLCNRFPAMTKYNLNELISENLISPFQIDLAPEILKQAQNFASAIYQLRESQSYQNWLSPELSKSEIKDPKNKSLMMSYDFHLTADQGLKLIEINTNAAFLGMGLVLNESRKIDLPVAGFGFDSLKNCIEQEVELCFGGHRKLKRIAIVDEKPEQQRLFVEFLLYQELFRSWGFDVDILDVGDLCPDQYDLIYNRHTDFLLSTQESAAMKKAFWNSEVCISPNPFDYILLADKQRMIDWYSKDLTEFGLDQQQTDHIRSRLPVCLNFIGQDPDQIWANRKNMFFKPMRAYGSKQSFKGASISRKAFDEIKDQDFIAQEYIPAPEFKGQFGESEHVMKYDLRFYAYQDKIQHIVARLYQGQVTNLRTPLGGFAPVHLKK